MGSDAPDRPNGIQAPQAEAAGQDPRSASAPGPFELAVSREELAAVSDEVAPYFPQPFNETRLVLLLVDPYHMHAYWHVRPGDMEAARAKLGADASHAPVVLRFYDITLIDFSRTPAHGHFDTQVHGLQNNWYVNLWADSMSYVADLGLRRPAGSIVAVVRSNVVHVPRARESAHYERTGIVLAPDGTAREVPDLVNPGVPSPPRQPTQAMPQEQVEDLVRQGYRSLARTGTPSLERPTLPKLRLGDARDDKGGQR